MGAGRLIHLAGAEPAWPFHPISSLYAKLGKDKWPLTAASYLPCRHELSHDCTHAAHQGSKKADLKKMTDCFIEAAWQSQAQSNLTSAVQICQDKPDLPHVQGEL